MVVTVTTTTTGPLAPAAALWMCAAETAPDKPDTAIDALVTSPDVRFTTRVPVPVPVEFVRGTSSLPFRVVLIVTVPDDPAGTAIWSLISPFGKLAVWKL